MHQVSQEQLDYDNERSGKDAMSKRNSETVEVLGVIGVVSVGLVLIVGSLVAVELLSRSPIWSESGAAWVQACGSIAALWVAIHIMKRQAQDARVQTASANRLALIRRMEPLDALLDRAHKTARALQVHVVGVRSYWDYFFTLVRPEELESIGNALQQIPLYTLESYVMVNGVFDMVEHLRKLMPYAHKHGAAGDVHFLFDEADGRIVAYHFKKISELRSEMRQSMRSLGYSPINTKEDAGTAESTS